MKHMRKLFLFLMTAALLCGLSSCSSAGGPTGLAITQFNTSTDEDEWMWMYQEGADIPGYERSEETVDGFHVTLYRSVYEYDTMHPMTICFIDQPDTDHPSVYGYQVAVDGTDSAFYGGYAEPSPWHGMFFNAPEGAQVTIEIYLFGEDGADILEQAFANGTEAQMADQAVSKLTYSLTVSPVSGD